MIDMVIAEDQAMLRDSLACAIDMQDDMHVVAAIADAADALSAVEKHHANLALLDVCTENDSSGIVAAAAIKQAHPDVRVVIMTGMPEITFVEQARAAGVDSFVYKNVGTAELIAVIRST
ncbi:MAG: DNA-binding response regulator, partial [Senegalimassilia anaerobia]|nr:DNA-binding response regulator [Senegalimassilia anaerobia]